MNIKVTVDGLADVVNDIIEDYSVDLLTATNKAVKEMAKWGAQSLKMRARSAGIGGSRYVNSFISTRASSGRLGDVYTISSRDPHYRVAHLLEDGHAIYVHGKGTGKRTRPRVHWEDLQDDIDALLTDKVIAAIERLN